ncbi:transposase [Aminirod propionatiphilus]|uniref:Transposase n=1 Tax=Aminirod propionatiphilus TaxID=3415223 RepID=A0ACD1DUH4_9BACT|nr:transposase [Synergistota bacterium]
MRKGARKSYSAEFKAQAILKLLEEQKSLSELASAYEVHPPLLTKRRMEALGTCPRFLRTPEGRGRTKRRTSSKISTPR